MITVDRILCPVDFSPASRAGLEPAFAIGEQLHAEILLFHAIHLPYPQVGAVVAGDELDDYHAGIEDEVRRRFDLIIEEEAHRKVLLETRVVRGRPASAIVQAARDSDADLIVMPTHSRPGQTRALPGSVTARVVRRAPCPVLSVRPAEDEPFSFEPTSVLVATDLSPSSEAALPWAFALANAFGASVLMLHVVSLGEREPVQDDALFPPIPPEIDREVMAAAWQRVDAQRAAATAHGPVETRVIRGLDPAAEIVRVAAASDAGIVVMGTRGQAAGEDPLGSNAEKVVRDCPRPVLTVGDGVHTGSW